MEGILDTNCLNFVSHHYLNYNGTIPITITMLSTSKWTLFKTITSYVLNAVLPKVAWVGCSRIYDPLTYGVQMCCSLLGCKCIVIIFFDIICNLFILIICLVAKTCNVAGFATIIARFDILMPRWIAPFAFTEYYCGIITLEFFPLHIWYFVHQTYHHVFLSHIFYRHRLQGSDQVFVQGW